MNKHSLQQTKESQVSVAAWRHFSPLQRNRRRKQSPGWKEKSETRLKRDSLHGQRCVDTWTGPGSHWSVKQTCWSTTGASVFNHGMKSTHVYDFDTRDQSSLTVLNQSSVVIAWGKKIKANCDHDAETNQVVLGVKVNLRFQQVCARSVFFLPDFVHLLRFDWFALFFLDVCASVCK